MAMRKNVKVISFAYECDGCPTVRPAESGKLEDRPEGFYIVIDQVTGGGTHQSTGVKYFHDKQCMLKALQFGLSAMMIPKL
jgi:hypothetical protein